MLSAMNTREPIAGFHRKFILPCCAISVQGASLAGLVGSIVITCKLITIRIKSVLQGKGFSQMIVSSGHNSC